MKKKGWDIMRGFNRALALITTVTLSASCILTAGQPAGGSLSVGESFRIYPSMVSQSETFIARHPGNHSILFVSANTINLMTGFVSEGVYVSTDAGTSWRGSDTCSGTPINFHGGDPGIAIDKDGRFVLIRLGNTVDGLYSHFSTDNGLTWSSQRTVTLNQQDRATCASDGNPASPYYGRSYAAWVEFAIPYPVRFVFTDDG
ncbi:MAG: glycoside hydrolase, partial [Ignavibacteria bacterium]|nr:glycoside hydrolase [Ignavibacteria bacterium]